MDNSEMDNDEKDNTKCSSPTQQMTADESGISEASLTMTLDAEDMNLGNCLQVIDALHYSCGFPLEISKSAVTIFGADFSSAYNYILDKYPIHDNGGPVFPITDCPHVGEHIVLPPKTMSTSLFHTFCTYIPKENKMDDVIGRAKDDIKGNSRCPSKDENWICLHCGVIRCSRYQYGHGIRHWEESQLFDPGIDQAGHCISASLADLSVWCHICKAYLDGVVVREYITRLEELKFGT
jgi:uncharacterized UBP type Zn finger protein